MKIYYHTEKTEWKLRNMEHRTVLVTKKLVPSKTIEEDESIKADIEQIRQPRFENRHYMKYHRCQRWVRTSFHR